MPLYKIQSNRPLHVKQIRFANGSTLEDKTAFIVDGFLIIEADGEDLSPTWYNLQYIEALEEVTPITHQKGSQANTSVCWL